MDKIIRKNDRIIRFSYYPRIIRTSLAPNHIQEKSKRGIENLIHDG